MANIETISLDSVFNTTKIINLSAPVGTGREAVNSKSDVLVVQALFKFLQPIDRGGRLPIGIPDSQCPEPTGNFDIATARLIKDFQKKYANKLSQDGIIHPAKNGNYEWGFGKQWTIFFLNSLAFDAALMKGADSYIQALVTRYPQVESTLNQLIYL